MSMLYNYMYLTCIVDSLQTNVMNNNNKYYLIQLLEDNRAKKYYVWQRWGRGTENPVWLLLCSKILIIIIIVVELVQILMRSPQDSLWLFHCHNFLISVRLQRDSCFSLVSWYLTKLATISNFEETIVIGNFLVDSHIDHVVLTNKMQWHWSGLESGLEYGLLNCDSIGLLKT